MHFVSLAPSLASAFFVLVALVPASSAQGPARAPGTIGDVNPSIKCFDYAGKDYPGKTSSCYVPIDRMIPGNPSPVVVHKDTMVQTRVSGRKPTENITFVKTEDFSAKPDLLLAITKAVLPGVTGIQGHGAPPRMPALVRPDPASAQKDLEARLEDAKAVFDIAGDKLACFTKAETYSSQDTQCTSPTAAALVAGAIDPARVALLTALEAARQVKLPEKAIRESAVDVSTQMQTCFSQQDPADNPSCAEISETLRKNQLNLEDGLTKLSAKQAALKTAQDAIATLHDEGPYIDEVPSLEDRKATVVVAAVDVLTKASVTLGTVTISRTGTQFIISTGMLVSGLRNRTFANSPIISGGVPSLDSSGKVLTVVTEGDTLPSFVTPLVLIGYELSTPILRRGKFGISVNAGLGANLTTKTADYAAGLGFRFRDVLFVPAVHIGRENQLTNGLAVGQMLGSSPPALPAGTSFVAKFGLAVTYRVPF